MQALKIENLRKTYKNGTEALRGVDLCVEEGDFFALLGPNGAGKSTTISILAGLVNKSSGKVRVFGHDIDPETAQAKSCIGLVPQEFNFNQFEPVEEILINQAGYYGINRKTARQRSEKYLKQLELWDKRRVMARELSGGMKRRLMIARALVHEPRLLILDEPTAGVDIQIRHSMWEFLRRVNREGTTVILTTHYLEEAEDLCRNIAIIDHGLTIEHTSMRELLNSLDKETFILYLDEHIQAIPESIQDCNLTIIDEQTIEVEISQSQRLNQVFSALSNANIDVIGMRNKTNRLEQLFMRLVENNRNIPELKQTLEQTSKQALEEAS